MASRRKALTWASERSSASATGTSVVSRLLEIEFKNAAMFGRALHLPLFRQLRRLERHGLDGANEFPGERRIDVKPAEHHTPGCANRRVTAVAPVDGLV